jgi:hypothetical protein
MTNPTIAQVIRETLNGTSIATLVTQSNCDALGEELVIALERAGFRTNDPVVSNWPVTDRRLVGEATLHLVSKPQRDGTQGVLDTQLNAVVYFTPVTGGDEWEGEAWPFVRPVVERYDVMLEGYTIPKSEDDKRHLSMFLTEVGDARVSE